MTCTWSTLSILSSEPRSSTAPQTRPIRPSGGSVSERRVDHFPSGAPTPCPAAAAGRTAGHSRGAPGSRSRRPCPVKSPSRFGRAGRLRCDRDTVHTHSPAARDSAPGRWTPPGAQLRDLTAGRWTPPPKLRVLPGLARTPASTHGQARRPDVARDRLPVDPNGCGDATDRPPKLRLNRAGIVRERVM